MNRRKVKIMELAATSLLCLGIFALFALVYCGIWPFKILRRFYREMWRPFWQWALVSLVACVVGLDFLALTTKAWEDEAAGKDTFWFLIVFIIELFTLYAMSKYEHNLAESHAVFNTRVNERMEKWSTLSEEKEKHARELARSLARKAQQNQIISERKREV